MEQKDTKQELEVFKHLGKGDQFVFYIFKKISKISYATYAITDLIKDTEPLKWTLRKTVTDLSALRNFFDEKSVFNNLERTLLELESFLELASFAKVVSLMNTHLLQNEIKKVIHEMSERSKEGFYSPELVASFFEIPFPQKTNQVEDLLKEKNTELTVPTLSEGNVFYKGHKGHQDTNDFYKKDITKKSSEKQKTSLPFIAKNTDFNKNNRQEKIIKIIKNSNTSLSIKDIKDIFPECSEKTIQRELIALVLQGQIKKKGERRWSTYSL